LIDPDSGKARIITTVTPSPIGTPSPSAQQDNGIPIIAIPLACIGILAVCCVVGFLEKK
jgi:hypothetical protein